MTTTKMPTEERQITVEPQLSAEIEALLAPYSGKDLENAQKAVRQVYKSGYAGNFHAIVARYREAIEEAVA